MPHSWVVCKSRPGYVVIPNWVCERCGWYAYGEYPPMPHISVNTEKYGGPMTCEEFAMVQVQGE